MPLLPGIHGLQFRRIAGNAWQYQMLGPSLSTPLTSSPTDVGRRVARRVLSELKL